MLENTRFQSTPIVQRHLDVWNPPSFSEPVDESTFVITPELAGRSDKIAYEVYGDSTLDWIILYYNKIFNPFKELSVGTILRIPNLDSVVWNG